LTTPWFTEELETAALDDKRLNDRFAEILRGRAELKDASRFFDNEIGRECASSRGDGSFDCEVGR